MTPKVSVIITIYNREKYIEKCVCSLFNQSLQEIEYIFIDDASTDRSVELLQTLLNNYSKRKSQSKLILLKTNSGVTNARNIGVNQATGEYIIHADSDDWVDYDMYEKMYAKAKSTNADIVGCDICHEYINTSHIFHQPYESNIKENIHKLIKGDIHPSLCTSLTKSKLIKNNKIDFPTGLNMGEDLYYNLQLFIHANKIIGMNYAPYHYRHTPSSSSFHHTKETIESGIMIGRKIEELMIKEKQYEEFKSDIDYRKFTLKLSLIIDFNNYKNYKRWLQLFPETNDMIWSFNKIDWKLRLELWLAAHHMYYLAKAISKGLYLQSRFRHLLTSKVS